MRTEAVSITWKVSYDANDGWPTFTFFVKVGIHAAGNHAVGYKSRMELESSTQNQNNKLSASVVPTFTKNVKVGHPSVRLLVTSRTVWTKAPKLDR